MRTEQIRYFLETAQCGSMSEVAEKNFITQPSVSTAISKLEKELNAQLIIRSNQGVILTEAGQIAQRQLQQILQLEEQLHSQLQPYRTIQKKEPVTIPFCTTMELSIGLVNQLLRQFQTDHPGCIFTAREYDFLDILSIVGQGYCQFGIFCIISDILNDPAVQQKLEAYQLETKKISSDYLYVGVSQQSPLAQKSALPLRTVLQHPLVIYNSSLESCWHDLFLKNYPPQPQQIKTNRASEIMDLVQNHGYLLFVMNHYLTAQRFFQQESSYALIPVKERIKVTTGVVYKKNQQLHPYSLEFLRLLAQQLSAL